MEDSGSNLKQFIDDVQYAMFDNTPDALGQMETPLIDGGDGKDARENGISPVSITSPGFQRPPQPITVPRMQEIDQISPNHPPQVHAEEIIEKEGNITASQLHAENHLTTIETLPIPTESILSNEHALSVTPAVDIASPDGNNDTQDKSNATTATPDADNSNQASNDASPEVPTFTRVDSATMAIVENPLQKSGRHTVITGRLPDNDPFYIGVQNLGVRLVSKKFGGYIYTDDEAVRRDNFEKDLYAFLNEMRSKGLKIPIIGGGNLDLYALAREVMLLGGVQNVVKKRAFRIVGQQLELPKSCTSAAFVLKGAYEKLLFHYEQKLVFDIYPEDPFKAVNMKMIVSAEKEAERKAAKGQASASNSKRRQGGKGGTKRDTSSRDAKSDGKAVKRSKLNNGTANDLQPLLPEEAQMLYISMVKDFPGHQFSLPAWSQSIPTDESYDAMISACHQLDMNGQVTSGQEVILLAMAECFIAGDVASASSNTSPQARYAVRDLSLAKAICTMPDSERTARKAQAFLFHLLVSATTKKKSSVLADNRSANGLINGLLVQLLQYLKKSTQEPGQANIGGIGNSVDSADGAIQTPANELCGAAKTEATNQEVAAAYCALRVIANLSTEPRNQAHLVAHGGLLSTFAKLINYAKLHQSFCAAMLETLENCASLLPLYTDVQESSNLLEALVGLLDRTTIVEEGPEAPGDLDFETSTKILSILSHYSRGVNFESGAMLHFINSMVRLMFAQQTITNLEALATICHNLVATWPELARQSSLFVSGILQLIGNARCSEFATVALGILHRTQNVFEFGEEIGRLCVSTSGPHLKPLAGIMADILLAGASVASITQGQVVEILKGDAGEPNGDAAVAPVMDLAMGGAADPIVDAVPMPIIDSAVAPVVDAVGAPVGDPVGVPVVDPTMGPVVDALGAPIMAGAMMPVVDGTMAMATTATGMMPVVDAAAMPVMDPTVMTMGVGMAGMGGEAVPGIMTGMVPGMIAGDGVELALPGGENFADVDGVLEA